MAKTNTPKPAIKTTDKPTHKTVDKPAVSTKTKSATKPKAKTDNNPTSKPKTPIPNPLYPSKEHGKKSGSGRGNTKKAKKSV